MYRSQGLGRMRQAGAEQSSMPRILGANVALDSDIDDQRFRPSSKAENLCITEPKW